jgi:CBS domain-containing protein
MKVKDIIKKKGKKVITIAPEKTLYDAAKLLTEKQIGSLVVVDQKKNVMGIVTERDIVHKLAENHLSTKKTRIKDLMPRKLLIATLEDETDYINNVITTNRVRHLPVLQDNKLVGIISIGDILKESFEQCRVENKYLNDYITGKYF